MSFIQIYPKDSKPNKEAYIMPWESDATCYNFNEPGVFIPDDSIDEMIRDPMDVETLVVTADLKDYDFIEKMKNLRQLYLYNAGNFWNLSIIKDLIYLRQICIMHGISYMYEYTIDEVMSGTCDTCAYIRLKNQGTLILPEKKAEENGEFVRPEEMKSDALWDIYSMFHNMRRPYIWVGSGNNFRYSLYLIKDISFGHGETDYGVGNMGIELPWNRKEWLDLKLVKAYGNGRTKSTCRICTDAISRCNDTMEMVLRDNNIKLPDGFEN